MGYSPRDCEESHTAEWVTFSLFSSVSHIYHSTYQSLWTHTSCFSSRNSYWIPVMCQALEIQWLRKRTPWLHIAYMWSAMMVRKMICKSRLTANRDTVMGFCVHHHLCPRSISYGSCHPILKVRKVRLCSVCGGDQFHQAATASLGQSLLTPNPAYYGLLHHVTSQRKEEIWNDRKKEKSFQNKSL